MPSSETDIRKLIQGERVASKKAGLVMNTEKMKVMSYTAANS